MYRSWLSIPRTLREWAIGLAIAIGIGALLVAAYQPRVDRGEMECRTKCASSGDTYSYVGPSRSSPERCTCSKPR